MFMTTGKAARKLGVTSSRIRARIYNMDLFAIRIFGRWRVFLDEESI